MGKSGKTTLEERINETVFSHLFEGIEVKCHICGYGGKRNLRPLIYVIKNKFQQAVPKVQKMKIFDLSS